MIVLQNLIGFGAHQSEVEDYVEMIAELITETGEARTVDLASRFCVTSPTVNAIVQRLQREELVEILSVNLLNCCRPSPC